LAKTLNVPTPAIRKPGSAWIELPRSAAAGTQTSGHVRIGYARASTVRQSLDTQLDSLKAADVTRIFHEKVSTRATNRPELERAVALAREMRASGAAVTLVVNEHKRLGRGDRSIPRARLGKLFTRWTFTIPEISSDVRTGIDPRKNPWSRGYRGRRGLREPQGYFLDACRAP
jgi:hypothetical protein